MPVSALHWLLVFSSLFAISFFCIGLTSYFERRPDRPSWVRLIHDTGMLLSLMHLAGVVIFEPRSDTFAVIATAFREERVWLSSPRAEAYREYSRRTGMFFPMFWRK